MPAQQHPVAAGYQLQQTSESSYGGLVRQARGRAAQAEAMATSLGGTPMFRTYPTSKVGLGNCTQNLVFGYGLRSMLHCLMAKS